MCEVQTIEEVDATIAKLGITDLHRRSVQSIAYQQLAARSLAVTPRVRRAVLDHDRPHVMAAAFAEPHSTKALEDGLEWGHGTTTEARAYAFTATNLAPGRPSR